MTNKNLFLLFMGLMLSLSIEGYSEGNEVRIYELFNFDWKFHYGDTPKAELPSFNDTHWKDLDLPHDFQIEQPWDKNGNSMRGYKEKGTGWYRKTFDADFAWRGKRILLDFEGIMAYGDVWVNGEKVGGTDYGYLGFEADISKLLNYEGKNVVAVRTTTGDYKNNASRWYTGGGIFRDVHLIVKDTISVARHGIFITTPEVSENNAKVSVQVEIEGFSGRDDDLQIAAKVFSPQGDVVGEAKLLAPKNSKKSSDEVLLPELIVTNPQLWSCEIPNIYTAEVTLSLNNIVLDKEVEKFGIRTLEFSKEFGFKLNGKKVFLKGICTHHDFGALGAAAFESAISRQMDKLKEFGFNHIRTAHNPYSESFLRLADEKGILIVDELYDKWSNKDYWVGRRPWTQLVFENIPEWIKRDRNHPSVIMWSFGNELQMREDLIGFPTGDWGVTTYKMLDVLAKRYDHTRKTTVAMFPSRAGAITRHDKEFNTKILPPELAMVTDIASFNYRFNDYREYLKHDPNLIIYQSEATTNQLLSPYFGMDRDKMVGLAYWGAIEYWGESSGWPRKGWTYSYFNHALEPFPQAYLIKSAFEKKPLVHIGVVDSEKENIEWNDITIGHMFLSSHWNRKSGSVQNLFTFTNANEVELIVNGKSFGIQKNDTTEISHRNMIYWQNIPYDNGGDIVAVAHTNGKEVARHRVETTGKAVALRLEVENNNWIADGMDLQYVKVYAVDNKGRKVPTAEEEVTFEVSGAAKLIAVDNGDHTTDRVFSEGNSIRLHNGFAMAILRAGQTIGEATIKVTAEEFKTAKVEMLTHEAN